jgi:hypothetical protein
MDKIILRGGDKVSWLEVKFGKHKGKTLPQIVLGDPDWFFWAHEKDAFKDATLKKQAKEIYAKATRIKIPEGPGSVVEYVIHPSVGKLVGIKIVPADRPEHEGSSPTHRLKYFDLSFPRRIAPYDKMGGRIIIDAVKRYVFGKPKARLTRARCETFFSNDKHFG